LKDLVEDYIDNKSVVRFAVGLGPRTKPSFFRFDIFSKENRLDVDMENPCICGICKDEVSPNEGYATNCLVIMTIFQNL